MGERFFLLKILKFCSKREEKKSATKSNVGTKKRKICLLVFLSSIGEEKGEKTKKKVRGCSWERKKDGKKEGRKICETYPQCVQELRLLSLSKTFF